MKETLEWTKLIESWIKIVAIFTAGMWTWWLFVRRRQKYPRAITSHAVQIHELDSNTRLVHLELAIENKGEVLVEISEGKAFIQQIVPLAGNVQSLTENGQNELNWPYIDRIIRLSELKRMEIEPSEKDTIHFEFVINSDISLFKAQSYLENERKRKSWSWKKLKWEQREIGWHCASIHSANHTEKEKLEMAKDHPQPPPPPVKQPSREQIQTPPPKDPPPVSPSER